MIIKGTGGDGTIRWSGGFYASMLWNKSLACMGLCDGGGYKIFDVSKWRNGGIIKCGGLGFVLRWR